MKNRNIRCIMCIVFIALFLTGCTVKPDTRKNGENDTYTEEEKIRVQEKLAEMSESYAHCYQASKATMKEGSFMPEQMHEMAAAIAEKGYPIICGQSDDNMQNYEPVSKAITRGKKGERAKIEFYSLTSVGGVVYFELQFAKGELTVMQANANWTNQLEFQITYMDKVKVYDWEYTKKGWLMWEKEKSQNQEMDMHCMYRILPLEEECRTFCEQYIAPVSYMGNNLFLMDWDEMHMDKIVWNDLFEFLYPMKYKEPFVAENFKNGIEHTKMAEVISSYFSISQETLERGAGFNKEQEKFYWSAMGSGTVIPQVQPFPEVVSYEKKEDKRIYLTVDAVSVEQGSDQIFSHCVVLQEREDGSMAYVGNQILHREGERIPYYMPRNEQMR